CEPARGEIKAPDGTVMEKAGAVRDGGSFPERMGKVACWNSVMDEDRYMVKRWNEFIAASPLSLRPLPLWERWLGETDEGCSGLERGPTPLIPLRFAQAPSPQTEKGSRP